MSESPKKSFRCTGNPKTSRLDDLDFWGDEGFGDQGGEVGHDLFDFGAAAGEACD